MKRLQWDKDKETANLSPLEKENLALKEENRRLQGLLELREDRSALEKYQVQSRNQILVMVGACIIALLAVGLISFVYVQGQIASRDQELQQNRKLIKQLKEKGKNGSVIDVTNSDQ